MRWQLVVHFLGALSMMLAVALLPSLALALGERHELAIGLRSTIAFGFSAALAFVLGFLTWWLTRHATRQRFTASEGFAVAAFGWPLVAILGALPMWLCANGALPPPGCDFGTVGMSPGPLFSYVDAFFECMSGLTTTGSSVFGTCRSVVGGRGLIEALPRSFLFWRSLTHWLGGMGIVVLVLALLPALRAGGIQAMQAEVPGPTADRLLPRVRQTAAILWGVYLLLSAAETLLLWLGDMPFFDALCHSFGTMATGGFSTKDLSIGHYAATGHPSALYFEMVIDLFMFLAGVNFLLHFQALRGRFEGYRRNAEFRFYVLGLAASVLILSCSLRWAGTEIGRLGWGATIRSVVFQVLSMTTTTGFATADFDAWPAFCRIFMVMLMFFGGCAGSTGGGMKQIRVLVVLRYVHRSLLRLLRPGLANRIRLGSVTVEERLVGSIVGLVLLWLLVCAVASLLVVPLLGDAVGPGQAGGDNWRLVTGATAVVATLNNIGPGLAGVGASCNFGWIPWKAKLLLCFCMLLGRLEIYSVFVVFLPMAWRR